MKHIILMFVFLLPIDSIAQFDFDAIADIEKKKEDNDKIKRAANVAKALKKAKVAKQNEERKSKLAKQKLAAANALKREVLDDKKADKVREQSYEDELRALNLQVMRAKADRTNDFIDSDLAKAAASTDGIQADADRTRMRGTAEIKRAENPVPVDIKVEIND